MCQQCRAQPLALSRRGLLSGAGALLAASAVPFAASLAAPEAQEASRPNAISPAQALERLMQGNARYAANEPHERDFSAGRAESTKTQHPFAAVLGCSDSRVVPDLVFDQGPGDLFIVRVAGNVVNTDGLASFEHAVEHLGVSLLMVLGHSNCGAVTEALGATRMRKELPGHLDDLVKAIEPAVIAAHGRHPSDFLAAAIEENVRLSMKRLMQESEILSEALAQKKIAVSGGVYDLASGTVNLI
jgi:carbonic anhydrase